MHVPVPVVYHQDLYRYWDARRAGRGMPTRADLDPNDLRRLLPHLTLIDRPGQEFRYRLVGTAVSQELGRDLTGSLVGSYVTPPEYAREIRAIYERVFADARPVFTTGEYRSQAKTVHAISRLILPLSEDGSRVNMAVFTRVTRFNRNIAAGIDWLKGAPGKVCGIADVASAADVGALAEAWERQFMIDQVAA